MSGLGQIDDRRQGIGAAAEGVGAGGDALGVIARLAQMGLQGGAVATAGRHGDLGLQHAHEAHLVGMRFGEVLHDLLLGTTHVVGLRELGGSG